MEQVESVILIGGETVKGVKSEKKGNQFFGKVIEKMNEILWDVRRVTERICVYM